MVERAAATEIKWAHQFEPSLERARQRGMHVLLDFSAAPM